MLHDRYGLALSTSAVAAVEAYTDAADRLLSANHGVTEGFARAVAADEGFALGHAGLALAWLRDFKPERAKPAIARALALADGLTGRERGHVAAIAALVAGDAPLARRLLREHLADHPRDAILLTTYGRLIRSGPSPDWPQENLALMDEIAGEYGEDWWFLGEQSFVRQELRQFAPALDFGERSLALYPRNANPMHSLAHVYYETAEHQTGHDLLTGWVADYHQQARLHGHLWWHLALHDLALGRYERAIATYERSLRPDATGLPEAQLPDAASFLWRWLLYGLGDAGAIGAATWGPVRDLARQLAARPGGAFIDAHTAMAFAGAGDAAALGRLIDGLKLLEAQGNTIAGEIVVPLALGLDAFAQGDYAATIDRIAPIADRIVQIGGSHAQREVFEDTLLQAYLRAGRFERAATLLQARLEHRHSARDIAWLGQAEAGATEH